MTAMTLDLYIPFPRTHRAAKDIRKSLINIWDRRCVGIAKQLHFNGRRRKVVIVFYNHSIRPEHLSRLRKLTDNNGVVGLCENGPVQNDLHGSR